MRSRAKRFVARALSRALPRRNAGGAAVFIFHSIGEGCAWSLPTQAFEGILAALCSEARVVGADELSPESTIQPTCALTFDDGYEDFAAIALPRLEHLSLPATLFVCTGWLDGVRSVPTQLEENGRLRPISWDAVRFAAGSGVTIGAHSVSHRPFSHLDADAARAEIAECRARISDETHSVPRHFAFPYGKPRDFTARDVDIATRSGFERLYDTSWDFYRGQSLVPRIEVEPTDTAQTVLEKLHGEWDGVRIVRDLRTALRLKRMSVPAGPLRRNGPERVAEQS